MCRSSGIPSIVYCRQYQQPLFAAFILVILSVVLVGCGPAKPVVFPENKFEQQLQRIGAAYSQASVKLGRPPSGPEELMEFLQVTGGPSAAETLRSPHDGEDYVIVWNVDFRQLAMSGANVNDVIIAYEKRGKNGTRYVMKPPSHVTQISDLEFKSAKFPPGHQPAL
ncbi:MAG: hypothetical protein ACKOUR_11115 [Planctomycetota bacterium]